MPCQSLASAQSTEGKVVVLVLVGVVGPGGGERWRGVMVMSEGGPIIESV